MAQVANINLHRTVGITVEYRERDTYNLARITVTSRDGNEVVLDIFTGDNKEDITITEVPDRLTKYKVDEDGN